MIQDKDGITPRQQHFVFKGVPMEATHSEEDYAMPRDAIVDLVLHLRGD